MQQYRIFLSRCSLS